LETGVVLFSKIAIAQTISPIGYTFLRSAWSVSVSSVCYCHIRAPSSWTDLDAIWQARNDTLC